MVSVCGLSCPGCNGHAQYCHLWPVRLYNTFPHYLIRGRIFEKKKLLNTKCVFLFHLQLLSETFLILRRTERDMIKIYILVLCIVPVILIPFSDFNPLNAELNSICHLLALLEAHHILHVSGVRVKEV